MTEPDFSRRLLPRVAIAAVALLLPLVSAWNLVAPDRNIKIGPTLGGVTRELPLVFSWSSIRDGSFQKAAAARITEAFAFRPILIRVNNEIRYELFGDLTAPNVVRGAKGNLIGQFYLDEYCSRTEGMGERLAADTLPKLRDIQNYYRERGSIFVYLVSPSKAANVPEYFIDRVPCPNTTAARTQLVPQYVSALRAGGIDVLDTASLIHSLKGHYPFDLFSQGGEHWNDVGGALAVSALVEEINRQAGHAIVPPFTFSYTLSNPASGADRELVDLLNVFFPPLGYLTPKVQYAQPVSCADSPARTLDIDVVGDSFSHLPGSIMTEHNCLAALKVYYYGKLGLFGGVPYHELQRNLADADLAPLRDAKVMVLEENESFVARSSFTNLLYDVVSKR